MNSTNILLVQDIKCAYNKIPLGCFWCDKAGERVYCELLKSGETVNSQPYVLQVNCLAGKPQEKKPYIGHGRWYH